MQTPNPSTRILNFVRYTFILGLFVVVTTSLSSETDDIQQMKKRIKKHRKYLKKVGADKSADKLLSKFNQSHYLQSKLISQIDKRIEKVDETINRLRNLLSKKKENFSQNKKLLENVVVKMYKTGGIKTIEFLVGARSLPDLLRRAKTLEIIADNRERLYHRVKRQKEEVTDLINNLSDYRTSLVNFREMKKKHLQKRDSTQRGREQFIQEIESDEEKYEVILRRLEKSSRKLKRLSLKKLSDSHEFSIEKIKNKMPWPIKSDIMKIIRSYGTIEDKKYGTQYHNSGIDIKTKAKAPIYSVASGEVSYKGWLKGYENIVVIKHPQRVYTIYGNLSKIFVEKGDNVTKGTLLGKVSPNGWFKGPKLHFEVRRGKKEINPLICLQGR